MILIQVNLYYTDNLDLADMSWFLKENSWCLRIPEGKGFGDIYQLFSDRQALKSHWVLIYTRRFLSPSPEM